MSWIRVQGLSTASRFRRVLSAAALAGVKVVYDRSLTLQQVKSSPEWTDKFPLGYLPTLEDSDGFLFAECGAIAEYLVSIGSDKSLLGRDLKERALIRQWEFMADTELVTPASIVAAMCHGSLPYHVDTVDGLLAKITTRLQTLNDHLSKGEWMVGESMTLADLFVVTACTQCFATVVDRDTRERLPYLMQLVRRVIEHDKLKAFFDDGEPKFIQDRPTPTPSPSVA